VFLLLLLIITTMLLPLLLLLCCCCCVCFTFLLHCDGCVLLRGCTPDPFGVGIEEESELCTAAHLPPDDEFAKRPLVNSLKGIFGTSAKKVTPWHFCRPGRALSLSLH
jgi:hypothetical protein